MNGRPFGVVILGYRDPAPAVRTATELVESGIAAAQVIVVMNALADAPPPTPFTVIAHTDNPGYSVGMNVGIKAGLERGWDAVAMLTHDAAVTGSTLEGLWEVLQQHQDVAVVGPVLLNRATGTVFSGGGGIAKHGVFHHPDAPDALRDVAWVDGAVLMVRSRALQEAGLLDERFFLYAEDVELSLRLRRLGWGVVIDGGSVASHFAGYSSPERQRVYEYLSVRNGAEVTRLHYGAPTAGLFALRQLRGLARRNAGSVSRRAATALAVFDFLRRRFGPPPPTITRHSDVVAPRP